ncbi:HD domain-containing protein [Methanoculleus sp. FWC-SCC1]|uniref:HD domain-containing protein n=1 Tax=Methanoculleus frigidifontis TaxID=2584085 RepID=A0ABT8MBT7_9EURY|nr:HD domain-containing protein [Methanoculleus sp. FWC-SCC1]MDN7025406.1 HD domain-containing protein [Methanoculleus sp. FWC-SCC1]
MISDTSRDPEKPYHRDLPTGTKQEIASYIAAKEALYAPFATKSADGMRRHGRKEDDIRTRFSRDADRIVHTKAYARYIDKTQVFYLVQNDHITHRVLHVQLVSKIGRTIGRSLRLNEDLIEAIALGHDIGHIPYGHTGEACLSLICEREGIGAFRHNVQGVRFLDEIEDQDLTLQVLDGILCHNGEAYDSGIAPQMEKTWDSFDAEIESLIQGGEESAPMTLEGCVVRFADTIAYIGRDIQDAQEVGLIDDATVLPDRVREVLGESNPAIIDTLIKDVIEASDSTHRPSIGYSPAVAEALAELKRFNYKNIYNHPQVTAQHPKIQQMYEAVFSAFCEDLEDERKTSPIYTDFIDTAWTSRRYLAGAAAPEIVRDYIAGMTDRYFEHRFREIVLPTRVDWRF